MQKQELIKLFIENHLEVVRYIDGLDDLKLTYYANEKWTAGQQLEHIYLTIKPFPKLLSAKAYIKDKFGPINRTPWSFESILKN